MMFINILHAVQYGGFVSAQITNAVLIYLIATRARTLFGSYRYVMGTFALYSLIYAWIEVLTQPVMHIVGPVFVVYMDSPLKYETWIGRELTTLYCGSFALVISLLAAQFFYRYIVFCHPEFMKHFDGLKLIRIFLPCIACFISWFEFVYHGMANTTEKQLYLKNELAEYYEEDSEKVSFIAPMYWSRGKQGEKIWKVGEVMSSVGCVGIILICSSTIVFCALKIYFNLKKVSSTLSCKTFDLNHQLFLTLSFQTLLPFVMMYSPVGLLIVLPFFEVSVGRCANFVGASLAVYPSLEPLIAMFCIKDFRKAVLSCPGCPSAPGAPGVPACPCAPAAPGCPSCPAGPCGPGAPAAPGVPIDLCPFCPAAPGCPSAPGCPGAPASPCGPAGPAGPGCPAGPSCPGCPSGPCGPGAPGAPAGPASPAGHFMHPALSPATPTATPLTPGFPASPGCPSSPGAPGAPGGPGGPAGHPEDWAPQLHCPACLLARPKRTSDGERLKTVTYEWQSVNRYLELVHRLHRLVVELVDVIEDVANGEHASDDGEAAQEAGAVHKTLC